MILRSPTRVPIRVILRMVLAHPRYCLGHKLSSSSKSHHFRSQKAPKILIKSPMYPPPRSKLTGFFRSRFFRECPSFCKARLAFLLCLPLFSSHSSRFVSQIRRSDGQSFSVNDYDDSSTTRCTYQLFLHILSTFMCVCCSGCVFFMVEFRFRCFSGEFR